MKYILSVLTCLTIAFLFQCLDPMSPEFFKKNTKITLSISKKNDNFQWAVYDSIPIKAIISNPNRIKQFCLECGEQNPIITLPIVTDSSRDTIIQLYCKYQNKGKKLIRGIIQQKENSREKRDSALVELGFKPIIKNNKKIVTSSDLQIGQGFLCWVDVEGSEQLSYQWYRGNDSLLNKTQNILSFNALTLSDEGSYSVRVKNCFGEDRSLPYILSLSTENKPPKITVQPQNMSTVIGRTVSFSIQAIGLDLKYQWQVQFQNLANAQDSILTIGPVTEQDHAKKYRCIVSNRFGRDTSSSVLLQFYTQDQQPSIIIQPSDLQININQKATFSVVASGTTLSYQWYKNGIQLSQATTSLYISEATQMSDSGSTFQCKVENVLGNVMSRPAILSVSAMGNPKIVKNPEDAWVQEHETARFSIIASGNSIAFQWLRNSQEISGATNSVYEIFDAIKRDSGAQFSCKIISKTGSIESKPALLHVFSGTNKKPKISKHPESKIIEEGGSVVFEVEASGENNQFQWQENKNNIEKETKNVLKIAPITANKDGFVYRCIVSNTFGSDTSKEATLNLPEVLPEITKQFDNSIMDPQKPCTLAVLAKGNNCIYEWYKDNTVIEASKKSFYVISAPSINDIGRYFVKISNSKGFICSDTLFCVLLKWKVDKIDCYNSNFISLSSNNTMCYTILNSSSRSLKFIQPSSGKFWETDCSTYDVAFIGNLIFIPKDDKTMKFYSSSGQDLGDMPTSFSSNWNASVLTNGNVICPSYNTDGDNSNIFCLNPQTKMNVWEEKIPGKITTVTASAAGTFGIVINDKSTIRVETRTSEGAKIKSFNLNINKGCIERSSILIFDENSDMYLKLVDTNSQCFFYKIDQNGQIIWTKVYSNYVDNQIVLSPNNRLIVSQNLSITSLEKNDGSEVWKYHLQKSINKSSFIGICNDLNYYFLHEGCIRILSIDGVSLGKIKTPDTKTAIIRLHNFCFTRQGDIIFLTSNNEVYQVQTKATGLAETSWPVKNGDLFGSYRSQK